MSTLPDRKPSIHLQNQKITPLPRDPTKEFPGLAGQSSIASYLYQLLNLNLIDDYREGVQQLGFNMEDLLEQVERDAALVFEWRSSSFGLVLP